MVDVDCSGRSLTSPGRWPAVAGALAFLGCFLLGLGLTTLAMRAPESDRPIEANEGFGPAVDAIFWWITGLVACLAVSLCASLAVTAWVAARERHGTQRVTEADSSTYSNVIEVSPNDRTS